jgi:hypothetical protein
MARLYLYELFKARVIENLITRTMNTSCHIPISAMVQSCETETFIYIHEN